MADKLQSNLVDINPKILMNLEATDRGDWDFEMYATAGEEASKLKFYSQWMIGKLGSEVAQKYGDIKKWADRICMPVGSVGAYMNAYRRITEDAKKKGIEYIPDGYIPWGVIQMATRKEVESPIDMIEQLSEKGITTIEGAYREIKQKTTGKTLPRKPKIKLVFNEEKQKWQIKMDPSDFPEIDWSDIQKQLVEFLSPLI